MNVSSIECVRILWKYLTSNMYAHVKSRWNGIPESIITSGWLYCQLSMITTLSQHFIRVILLGHYTPISCHYLHAYIRSIPPFCVPLHSFLYNNLFMLPFNPLYKGGKSFKRCIYNFNNLEMMLTWLYRLGYLNLPSSLFKHPYKYLQGREMSEGGSVVEFKDGRSEVCSYMVED